MRRHAGNRTAAAPHVGPHYPHTSGKRTLALMDDAQESDPAIGTRRRGDESLAVPSNTAKLPNDLKLESQWRC
jgi:hypothetical protein